MPQPELIAPRAQSTPRSFGGSRRPARATPDDLLKQASRRLEIMSLLATAIWTVSSVAFHIQLGSESGPHWIRAVLLSDNIAVVAVIASLAPFSYARNTNRDPKHIPNLGPGYMVVTAAAIGLITRWSIDPKFAHLPIAPTISWIYSRKKPSNLRASKNGCGVHYPVLCPFLPAKYGMNVGKSGTDARFPL